MIYFLFYFGVFFVVVIFIFTYFGVFKASWIYTLMYIIIFEKLLAIISTDTISDLFFSVLQGLQLHVY